MMGDHTSNLISDTMRSILENTQDFMFVKDKNLIYVGSSQAFAVDCACRNGIEDVIGKTDYEVFEDSSFAEKYRKDDEELLLSRKAKIEYREAYPGKNGEDRYCLTTKYLILDADGEPAGVFGQSRDITEQVRLEQLDDQNREKLEQDANIFHAMQDVYDVILYFDFEKDYYFHAVGEKYATETIKQSGKLSEVVPTWLYTDMTIETRTANMNFFDLSTMQDRLTKHGILTRELESLKFGWIRISLLPVVRDEKGNVVSCLWVSESIGKEIAVRSSLQNRNEILEALRDVYDVCMYWNLADDSYFRVYGLDNAAKQLVPDQGNLHEILQVWLKNDLTEENQRRSKDFYDLSTLEQRLTKNGTLTMEIETISSGWLRISLVPAARDQDGTVKACLWVGEVIEEDKKKEIAYHKALEEATHIAETDALTGLLNRGGSEHCMIHELQNGTPGLFCLFDINSFKHINDCYGHAAGDYVLKQIAQCMKNLFHENDILARFGGDEFVIFSPEVTTLKKAQTILNRLVSEVEKECRAEIGNERIRISIGAFFYDGTVSISFGDVYEKCDTAMYHCKKQNDMPFQILGTGGMAPICGKRLYSYEMKDSSQEDPTGDREIITAISRMYLCSYYLDLVNNSYTVIKRDARQEQIHLEGYTTDIIVENYLQLCVHPKDRKKMKEFMDLQTLQQRMEAEPYIECEYQGLIQSGWYRARFIAIRHNVHGALTHVLFLVASLDRNMASELSEYAYSKNSLDALFNHVPGGIVMYEWDGKQMNTLYVSKYFQEQYGDGLVDNTKASQRGMDFSKIHPDDVEGLKKAMSEAEQKTNQLDHVYRVWNKDRNRYEWTRLRSVIEPQSDGTSYIYALYFDVTAQKEAEIRLEKSRASLNSALSASNQLSYEYDPQLHTGICYTDDNFFHLPKRIENYPDSLRDIELFHPEDAETFIRTAHQMDHGAKKAQCDVRIMKNGEYRWYSCMFDAYYDAEKERNIAILTVVDISDRMTSIQDYNERVTHLGLTKTDALSAGYINLDKDTYDCICIEDSVKPYLKEEIGFEQLMMETSESVVGEETREKYRKVFSLKNLREMAEQGQMRVQMEYLYRYDIAHVQWLEAVVDMVKNPITGEIGGVIYSRSIQKERLASLILQKTTDQHYSKVAVIIAETDEYFMFDSADGSYYDWDNDFWEKMYQQLKLYTDSITEEQINTQIHKTDVLKKLEENGEFSFVFENNRKGDVSRAELKFTYMEKSHNLILGYIRDITDRHLMEKLRFDSEHDALTGLYNRKKFMIECEQMLKAHPKEQFAMIHFDLKNFHRYNTFFGDQAGDQLLCDLAGVLREAGGDYDYWVYGRMESDVFCSMVPYCQELYEKHTQETFKYLKEYRDDYLLEPKFGLYFIHDRNIPIESMITRAAIAAKKLSNSISDALLVYTDQMEEQLQKEQSIVNEMQSALEQGQFQVYLQPKYALRTRQPVGAEALVRWIHPTKGMISPGSFIPIFEKNGFISNLDRYMWEQVCILIRKWMDEGKTVNPISVNVSRISIFGPNTVAFLKNLTRKYRIEPKYLELELTESAYIDNPDEIKPRLLELQEYGFKILMDDFGSGYSSLNILKDLPVDILKLDMRFLSPSEDGARGALVLSSIIRMSKLLGLPVIAEGVETRKQADYLLSIGCEYVQGYLFDHPMAVADYEEKILPCLNGWQKMEIAQSTRIQRVLTDEPENRDIFDELYTKPMAIIEYGREGFICLRANPAFFSEFGLIQDIRPAAKVFQSHMSNADCQHLLNAYQRCTEVKHTVCFEILWKQADGKECLYMCRTDYLGEAGEESVLITEFIAKDHVEYIAKVEQEREK